MSTWNQDNQRAGSNASRTAGEAVNMPDDDHAPFAKLTKDA